MKKVFIPGVFLILLAILGGQAVGRDDQNEIDCQVFWPADEGKAASLNIRVDVKIKTTDLHPRLSRADFEQIVDDALANAKQGVMAKYGVCFAETSH